MSQPQLENPLKNNLSGINQHLRTMNEFMEWLERAKAVGTPEAEKHEAHRQYLVEQFTKLKQHYHPNRP